MLSKKGLDKLNECTKKHRSLDKFSECASCSLIFKLDYLRGEIKAERISYGEIAELQSLAEYIADDDVVLLEWAGVEEN